MGVNARGNDRRLDHRGDRVEQRLDRRGDRIDQRLDRRGDQLERRFDRRADRASDNGRERLAARLENRGDVPIRTLPITLTPRWVEGALPVYGGVELVELEVGDHRRVVSDDTLGFYVAELAEPLAVGDGLDLSFVVRVDHQAWPNEHQNDLVVANGFLTANDPDDL